MLHCQHLLFFLSLTTLTKAIGTGGLHFYPRLRDNDLLHFERNDSLHPCDQSPGKIWYTSVPNILFQTDTINQFTLRTVIDGLPNVGNVEAKVRFECNLGLGFDRQSIEIDKLTDFCSGSRKINVLITNLVRSSQGQHRNSTLSIDTIITISKKHPPVEESTDGIIFIQILFYGPYWQLWTNGVTLMKMNWLHTISLRQAFHDEGVSFMSNGQLVSQERSTSNDSFASQPFLYSRFLRMMTNTTLKFLGSILSIGATVSYGSSMSSKISLLTAGHMARRNFSELKVMRVDRITGNLHYSRYGLAKAASDAAKSGSHFACGWNPDKQCSHLSVTGIVENACATQILKTGEIKISAINKTSTSIAGDLNDCKVLENGTKITVFSSLPQYVVCPIICTDINAYYVFLGPDKDHPENLTRLEHSRGPITVHDHVLEFGLGTSHKESGTYSCRVGDKTATFYIDVFMLPTFRVPNNALLTGYPPPKFFVMPQDDYSVSCTLFHSGLTNVSIIPQFRIPHTLKYDSWDAWYTLHFIGFQDRLRKVKSDVSLQASSDSFSTTVTLTVKNVPPLTEAFDFSHRFTCGTDELINDPKRFGQAAHYVESGSDVWLIPRRPTVADFSASFTPCCRGNCTSRDVCVVVITMNRSLLQQLQALGVKLSAEFYFLSIDPKSLHTTVQHWIKRKQYFHEKSAQLIWQMPKGLAQLSDEQRRVLIDLVPTFSLLDDDVKSSGVQGKVVRRNPRWADHPVCREDPSCLFRLDLKGNLSIQTLLGATQSFLDELPAVTDAPKDTTPDSAEAEWRRKILNKTIDKNRSASRDVSPCTSMVSAVICLCCLFYFVF